jgi:uncharacterized integral membrane protein (TIGR00697 family)
MNNEIIFFLQIAIIIIFSLIALRIGSGALITWVTVQAFIANLFVLKQITLFGLNVTASDVFAIGGLLGLNFLQEYFSRDDAKKAAWIAFFFMIFFAICSQLHLFYTPSAYDSSHAAFTTILSPTPRLLIASLTVFFVVQFFDMFFFAFLKKRWPTASFSLRAAITLTSSQLLDTFLFSFLGLYGIVASVFDIIVISFLIKLIVIVWFSTVTKWVHLKHG